MKALLIQDFLKAEEVREQMYLNLFPWHKHWKKDFFRIRGWGKDPEILYQKEMMFVGL